MASTEETESFDICNFELQLRERINELQWKSDSLEEIQKELSETRRLLYETQTELDDERRKSTQLEMQLRTMMETAKVLEADNMKNQTEQVRMKLKCDSALMERNVLIDQARNARLENMDFKIKVQDYERNLASTKKINETLEASLMEFKCSVSRLHTRLHSNVGKLEREQKQLRKSFDEFMQYGQRVKATLKNYYAAHQRDKRIIEELKKQLVERDVALQKPLHVSAAPEADDIQSLTLKMELTLKELRMKLENNSLDDKLFSMCTELRKMDKNLAKD